MLIYDQRKQQEQVHKKTNHLLISMAQTVGYIDVETAQYILGMTRQGAAKYLNRSVTWGYLKKHKLQMPSLRKRSIFGITACGVDHVIDQFEIAADRSEYDHLIDQLKPWSVHRFRGSTHEHEMLILKTAALVKSHTNNIIYPQFYAYKKRRADFAMGNEKGPNIAWEIELTIKSKKRYERILWAYRKHFSDHNHVCYWVTMDKTKALRLHRIIDEIESYQRQRHQVYYRDGAGIVKLKQES